MSIALAKSDVLSDVGVAMYLLLLFTIIALMVLGALAMVIDLFDSLKRRK